MPKRVLIIDDDAELRSEITEILRDEGFLVDAAPDGLKGYACAQQQSYDVILLDVKMPGISGLDMVQKIKTATPPSKIFLISGKPFLDKLIAEGNMQGLVSGVLSKPFDIALLLAKLKE